MVRKLTDGSRVAVIGGGPAGSFAAMFLLRFAREQGMRLHVDIYEWRSFSDPGPKGCNRCAGILSAKMLKNLHELGLEIPEYVARSHIASYHLHSPFGVIDIQNPDPGADILSVFRGGGPLHNSGPDIRSFDGFLLDRALDRGARLVKRRVRQVNTTATTSIVLGSDNGSSESRDEPVEYELIVLATGLNGGGVRVVGLPYSPAPTLTLSQDELFARPEDIQDCFGNSVRVFLVPHSDIVFASLVPKGNFVNVSLLGRHGPPNVEAFLKNEMVRTIMPFPYKRSCGCHPRISVGSASGYYGDGVVAVGDAAVTRLYKDGIGSALLTAREAAYVAVYHGVSRDTFRTYYSPFCRGIEHDNRMGRAIFAAHYRGKSSRAFFRANANLVRSERCEVARDPVFTRILWGILTGSYTYGEIWRMATRMQTILRLAGAFMGQIKL
ncbi:MAG: hypothetical protein HYX87_08410 [Chloroflexi bacterium]|nr:hypothetical protein [Chloroflexota bacterium]